VKKLLKTYKKQIEILVSIAGLVLTYITLTHNIQLTNVLFANDAIQFSYASVQLYSLEHLVLFIPVKYRKAIAHFYHKYFCHLAWGNFLFFIGATMYTNHLLGNSMFYHIGIVAVLEFIVLLFEKNPVEKMNKVIDFIISLLN
jgi:hypothetical protein